MRLGAQETSRKNQKPSETNLVLPEHFDRAPLADVEGEDDVVAADVVVVEDDGLLVDQHFVDVHRLRKALLPRVLVQLLGNHVPNKDHPFRTVAAEMQYII